MTHATDPSPDGPAPADMGPDIASTGLKAALVAKARQLGFDAIGITTASPPGSAARFESALAEGRHGEMAWIARNAEKRVDPQRVLPGARSIVTLAISYAGDAEPGSTPAPPDGFRGEVARYARHADYHDVLAGPLRELTAWLDEAGRASTRSLWYVDTGPILGQATVAVTDDDTEDSLAARILPFEHRLFVQALRQVAEGRVRVEGRRAHIGLKPGEQRWLQG